MAYICKDRHGTYYLRIVLNDEQRKVYRKGELRRSLGTKLKREALRRQPEAYLDAMAVLGKVRKPAPTKEPVGLFLSYLLKKYASYQKLTGVLPETIAKKAYSVQLLIRLVKDKPVDAYTKEDARLFRDKAIKLPKKGCKNSTISITTFNNYTSEIISFFNWCEREGYIDDNVFNGIKIKQKQLQSSYRGIFNPEDLKKIFDSIERTPNIRADRYWAPYIAFYTGCRINEACMLSKDDIYIKDDVWCIHIRAGKDYQRLKNAHSERIIPIHSELIKLGFIEYVNSVEDRLFPMLSITKSNSLSAQVSQWFGKLLKKLDIGPKKSFHSFRHTFTNILKQNGVDVSITASILGHSTRTISYDRYGKSLSPKTVIDVIEQIKL
ncbi:site-specific integrase [Vreelandella arcis]|uniref:Phage integrase family protein n=1 Tax=Vreelandella arcis TaxID=416873 RepID=A0A1H0FYF7_9GAMM|nr:site-specific integrase [Halomonas arcis]SDN99594.1 Phage integrase family protein [Halomonas arcis]